MQLLLWIGYPNPYLTNRKLGNHCESNGKNQVLAGCKIFHGM